MTRREERAKEKEIAHTGFFRAVVRLAVDSGADGD